MNRNKRIFAIVFISFVLVVILITIDMARRTYMLPGINENN